MQRALSVRGRSATMQLQFHQAGRTAAKHAKRRVGRGIGSGLGKTAGRGHKARSRAPAATTRSASRAARCRCSVCQEDGSTERPRTARSACPRARRRGRRRRPETRKKAGLVPASRARGEGHRLPALTPCRGGVPRHAGAPQPSRPPAALGRPERPGQEQELMSDLIEPHGCL